MQRRLFLVNQPEVKIITLTYNVLQWLDKMSHNGLENTTNKLLHWINVNYTSVQEKSTYFELSCKFIGM
jgi:hypothetical protein